MPERKRAFVFSDDISHTPRDFILARMDVELMRFQNVSNWWEHRRLINNEDKRTGMVEVTKEGCDKRSIEDWLKAFYEHEGYKVSVIEADKKREITAVFGEEQFKVDVTETERKFQVNVSKIISQ